MDPAFAPLIKLFTDVFSGVDFGLLLQRAIVGATLLTAGWFLYRYVYRPPGSLYWLRSEAHRMTADNQELAHEVAIKEGVVDGLKLQLHLIVTNGRGITNMLRRSDLAAWVANQAPPHPAIHPPSSEPPSTA